MLSASAHGTVLVGPKKPARLERPIAAGGNPEARDGTAFVEEIRGPRAEWSLVFIDGISPTLPQAARPRDSASSLTSAAAPPAERPGPR